jgi:16S rRNA processing protein RimM
MNPVPTARKREQPTSGSPKSGEPVYLTLGKLRRTHGLKGDLLFEVYTDTPQMIRQGLQVFVGNAHRPLKIASARENGKTMLIRFEGVEDCDQAAAYRNQFVMISKSDASPLAEGRFYHHEVIGMQVFDEGGVLLGVLTEIIMTGANDVYVIQPENGEEILLPAIKEFVKEIDRGSNRMTVQLPQWD